VKTSKPQRNLDKLSLQEYGLLCYIKASLDNDGLFQQQLSIAADSFLSTKPTVHRLIKNLIGKDYLKVIRKSRRGEDGWFIPAVLQPIPPVKPIENKQSPISFGTLEAITTCKPNRISVVCHEPDKHVALHQADEMEQAAGPLVDKTHSTPRPACTVCADSDCTNTPEEGSAYCYRHREQAERTRTLGES